MIYSIVDAIYDTYSTAIFQPVAPRAGQDRRPRTAAQPAKEPSGLPGRLTARHRLARVRRATGYALSALGASLQAGGDRLVGADPAPTT